MAARLLLLLAAAAAVVVDAQDPQDCPPCYTLVQEAVDAHRTRLTRLAELLQNVGSEPQDDRVFERKLSILSAIIEDLFNDARRAVIRDSSPLEQLGDLQERIEEVKKVAGSILVHMEEGRLVAGQGDRIITEAERIVRRIEQALRETLLFLEGDGADALRRAVEQSKQFGLQSARMSEIARQARQLADLHEEDAKALDALAKTAVSNSSAAYELAYKLLEQQRNFSTEISLLDASLISTETLVSQTRGQAAQAASDATEAFERALSLYTDAKSGFTDYDVDDLKRRADYLKAEAQRLKNDLEALTKEHGPMMDLLETDINSIRILIERGLSQQMSADELLADVTAARDKATEAVRVGEQTLEEARKTLETLLSFDRQVRESRDEATAALRQVQQILRMVEEAERKTVDARAALQGAERNAENARDIAAEAEALAEEAYQEASKIQIESSETKRRATQLRDEASNLSVEIIDTTVVIERYEDQVITDSALTREALEKASQAKSNAAEASAKVNAALKLVKEIMAALSAAGELDTSALDDLERRLEAAEAELADAELEVRLDELRSYRTIQNKMVRDYEADLAFLRLEVDNVQDIADALPTGCYARVKLEP